MKKLFIAATLSLLCFTVHAQNSEKPKLYDTAANPEVQIKEAIMQAKKEHKNILLQVGGNWCSWCILFHKTVATNDTLNQLLHDNYIMVHINYDQHNKTAAIWKTLEFPQRFGFPVFVIMNEKGKQIHIQDSSYLEEGKGYNHEKIADFFKQWSPAAIEGKTVRR